MKQNPLLSVQNLSKIFKTNQGPLHAIRHLSFNLYPGETLGLAGESGCGKSTVAKILMNLTKPTTGTIEFDLQNITALTGAALFHLRRHIQMIFQNPAGSLNPRFTVEKILSEPFEIHDLAKGSERKQEINLLLDQVGLSEEYLKRFPHEMSGGQKQRISLARALAVRPRLLICDEPLSALDLSIQAQIINLLKSLQMALGLTYLVISHDLSVLHYLADRIAIMYLGELAELAPASTIFHDPWHPYTKTLIASNPGIDPKKEKQKASLILQGEAPSPFNPPAGCAFHPRCPFAKPICKKVKPAWQEIRPGHFAACHLNQ